MHRLLLALALVGCGPSPSLATLPEAPREVAAPSIEDGFVRILEPVTRCRQPHLATDGRLRILCNPTPKSCEVRTYGREGEHQATHAVPGRCALHLSAGGCRVVVTVHPRAKTTTVHVLDASGGSLGTQTFTSDGVIQPLQAVATSDGGVILRLRLQGSFASQAQPIDGGGAERTGLVHVAPRAVGVRWAKSLWTAERASGMRIVDGQLELVVAHRRPLRLVTPPLLPSGGEGAWAHAIVTFGLDGSALRQDALPDVVDTVVEQAAWVDDSLVLRRPWPRKPGAAEMIAFDAFTLQRHRTSRFGHPEAARLHEASDGTLLLHRRTKDDHLAVFGVTRLGAMVPVVILKESAGAGDTTHGLDRREGRIAWSGLRAARAQLGVTNGRHPVPRLPRVEGR